MADTVQSFSEMLCAAMGDSVTGLAQGFLEMLAEDAVMEFPYAPPGMPRSIEGRTAIANYLTDLSRLLAFEHVANPTVHRTADPDVTILEFDGFGHGVESGAKYEQRYISVIRTRNGSVVHYRDYWNPLAVLAALRGPAMGKAVTVEGLHHG